MAISGDYLSFILIVHVTDMSNITNTHWNNYYSLIRIVLSKDFPKKKPWGPTLVAQGLKNILHIIDIRCDTNAEHITRSNQTRPY